MNNQQNNFTENMLPQKYKPLGMWAYFGYTLLFAIPIVGLICIIVFSFSDSNINRRNFARSYFCMLIISFILFILLSVLGVFASIYGGTFAGTFGNLSPAFIFR